MCEIEKSFDIAEHSGYYNKGIEIDLFLCLIPNLNHTLLSRGKEHGNNRLNIYLGETTTVILFENLNAWEQLRNGMKQQWYIA